MDRSEVLETSKRERNDEGVVFAENRGRKTGIAVFGIVAVALIVIAGFALPVQMSRAVTDVTLILTSTLGITEYLSKFRFTKQYKYAAYVALLVIMLVVSVYRFISVIAGVV